jgi:hypothetical protein
MCLSRYFNDLSEPGVERLSPQMASPRIAGHATSAGAEHAERITY